MVNITLPSAFRSSKRRQRSTRGTINKRRAPMATRARTVLLAQHQQQQEQQEAADKEKEGASVGPGLNGAFVDAAAAATNTPWVVCHDQGGRPFWLNTATGQQTYPMFGSCSGPAAPMLAAPMPAAPMPAAPMAAAPMPAAPMAAAPMAAAPMPAAPMPAAPMPAAPMPTALMPTALMPANPMPAAPMPPLQAPPLLPPPPLPPMMYLPPMPAQAPHFITPHGHFVRSQPPQQAAAPVAAPLAVGAAGALGGYMLRSVMPPAMSGSDTPESGEGGGKRVVLGPVMLSSNINNVKKREKIVGGEGVSIAGGKVKGGLEKKPSWPKAAWEECYDDQRKPVWIHTVTKQLVHSDPYD